MMKNINFCPVQKITFGNIFYKVKCVPLIFSWYFLKTYDKYVKIRKRKIQMF